NRLGAEVGRYLAGRGDLAAVVVHPAERRRHGDAFFALGVPVVEWPATPADVSAYEPECLFSVLFGFAIMGLGERGHTIRAFIDDAAHAVFGVISIVMKAAPIGAFGAMAFTIGKFGFGILASLGQLVASIYLTSILFVLIGFGAIAWLFRLPLLKIIRFFKDELLIAFTATSGEAMIPRSIEK
ncbi:MAG: cation:dicarboxylate symporter family transporter, partial [Pyrinomonadaceae bacterium]